MVVLGTTIHEFASEERGWRRIERRSPRLRPSM